jgi:anti-anti-sigma factor
MRLLHQVYAGTDSVRVVLSGEIDVAVQTELRTVLSSVVATATGAIELDLHQLTFLDCSGVNEFVRAHVHAQRHGRPLTVSGARGVVRLVLEVTDALRVLTADQPARAPTGSQTTVR